MIRKSLIIFCLIICTAVTGYSQPPLKNSVYMGDLVNMHRKDKYFNDIDSVAFRLNKSGKLWILTGRVGPVGKMPGYIDIELPVKILPDGKLIAKKKVAGIFKFKYGLITMKIYLDSLEGEIVNNHLTFTLDTYAQTLFNSKSFETSITFITHIK